MTFLETQLFFDSFFEQEKSSSPLFPVDFATQLIMNKFMKFDSRRTAITYYIVANNTKLFLNVKCLYFSQKYYFTCEDFVCFLYVFYLDSHNTLCQKSHIGNHHMTS